MGIDYDSMRFWWDVIQTLVMVVVAIWAWVVGRDRVNRRSMEAIKSQLHTDVQALSQAVVELQNDRLHQPSKQDVDAIHDRITRQGEALNSLSGQVKNQTTLLHTINEHLLSQSANSGRGS